MIEISRSVDLNVPVKQLRNYHERDTCFERLAPPWQKMQLVERSGGIAPGARTVFRGYRGPVRFTWVAEHIQREGDGFTDIQRRGPFASWRHDHDFEALTPGRSRLTDTIRAELPADRVVPGFARSMVASEIETLLRYRHLVTADDLQDAVSAPRTIAITGASGLIGSRLRSRLQSRGHKVVALVRGSAGEGQVAWNPLGDWDPSPLEKVDAVIHLAGESIGGALRWTAAKKERILQSRQEGTRSLALGLAKLNVPPRLVSASAVGFYGDRGTEELSGTSSPGEGFLSEVVQGWEAAADPARQAGLSVVHPRIGLVIAAKSGAMKPLLWLGRLGLLGPLGRGNQYWPWVSLHDVTRGLEFLATNSHLEGPVNLTGPVPISQREFAETLAKCLRRPSVVPVPAFAIRAALGEMGDELLLSGQNASPVELSGSDFVFSHLRASEAVADEFGLRQREN